MKKWYAVTTDRCPEDWGDGSARKRDAVAMAKRAAKSGSYLHVEVTLINDGPDPVAVGTVWEWTHPDAVQCRNCAEWVTKDQVDDKGLCPGHCHKYRYNDY